MPKIKWAWFIWTSFYWLLVYSLDVKPQHERYYPDYTIYHNLSQIQSHVSEIVARNPNFMKIDWSFRSRENRPQMLLHLTNFTGRVAHSANNIPEVPKVRLLLSYGEHAREFVPIETMFYLLQNLTDGLRATRDSPAEVFTRTILSKFDIYIIVMANPDGRSIVEKTRNYCWRGTSLGVDLNRNFDWEFGNIGSSGDPKDEEYRGEQPFSEPESRVYTELTGQRYFDVFVSLHSGIRHIYLPYADSVSKTSGREPVYIETIKSLAETLSTSTVYRYNYGKTHQLTQYTADGTIFDYMVGKAKVPLSIAIELWGKENHKGPSCFDEFNPRSSRLHKEISEIHPLYVSLFYFLINWKQHHHIQQTDVIKDAPSMTFGYILLVVVILITLFVAFHKRWCPCNKLFPRKRVISLKSLSSTISVWGFKSS